MGYFWLFMGSSGSGLSYLSWGDWKLLKSSWWRQNAEAAVAVAYLTEKESSEDFGEAVEALADGSEQLRRKVARLLDQAGNENLDL